MILSRAYRGSIEIGARVLVRVGLAPNQISVLSVVVAAVGCALFVFRRQPLVFAPLVLLGGFLDALDGEVARKTKHVTRFGGYLDAVCDRVLDSAVLFAIGWVSGYWSMCTLTIIGSYSVSYAKARAALEVPASNLGWPHLMGREERVLSLVGGILLWGILPGVRLGGMGVIFWWLGVLNVGLFVTAAQRFRHAHGLMAAADEADP